MTYTPYDMQIEAIINAGMKLLCEHLGFIETEIFIFTITRKGFDYTEWHNTLWEDLIPYEVFGRAQKTQQKYGVPDRIEIL